MKLIPDFRQKDKVGHFWLGFIVANTASLIAYQYQPLWVAFVVGVFAAMFAGVGKELSDWYQNTYNNGHHGVELLDAIATGMGGMVGALNMCILLATYQLIMWLIA